MNHVPLPEPIFTETVTDLDDDAGDVEFELSASNLRALRGPAYGASGELEAEWLLTSRLGFRIETQIGFNTGDFRPAGTAGVCWKLVRDRTHDWYAQLELVAHTLQDDPVVDPGMSPLPFALDVRAGHRFDWLTVRAGLGVAAGAGPDFALRGSLALLAGFDRGARSGFWGVEVEADTARAAPVVVALDLVPDLSPLGVPFQVGFALPWNVGADPSKPSLGFFVRLFLELGR